jgi:competence protein ComEC
MQFFISFLAGLVFFYSFQYFPLSTIFSGLLSSIYLSARKRFLLIFIVFSGIAFAFLRYEPVKDIHIRDKVDAKGIFESLPTKTDSGMFMQTLNIKSAVDTKTGEKLKELAGQEIILLSDGEFDPGTECDLAIKFLKSRKRLNPGEQNSDKLFANLLYIYDSGHRKISLNSKIQEYRYNLNKYIGENFKRDSGAFVASITTGQTANIDEELRDAFNVTGLTHILSISGSHFGLFSVLLFGIFRFLINTLPYKILQRITIFLTPSQAAAIACFPFMLAYLCLSGSSVPAVRSFIMIGLFLSGLIIGRKGFWLNSLLFAAFVITVWEPEVIFDLSFQLSFLAVLFIGFSLEKKEDEKIKDEKKEDNEDNKVIRYIKDAVLLTLSASIGTAPLVAYHFHYFSIISPISNLLIGLLIGFTLIPLSIVSSFLFLFTGHYIFTPIVSAVSDVSIFLVRLLSDVPSADIKIPAFPPIIVLLFYAGFIFYFLFNKRRYTLIIPFIPIVIYLSLSIFEKNEVKITFLDVGQGDSSVIELPDKKTMVIDTGKTGRETASFLKYRGKKTVDALIVSHSHPDHTGGLDYILKNFKVKELWYNGKLILPETFASIKHRAFNRGDVIEGMGYSIYIFHPYPEFYSMDGNEYVGANNDSLMLKLQGCNASFLFTGDVEEEAEEDVLYLGKWLESDVIKVPHHGGRTSSYEPFFEAVSPDVAVISVGRDNTFGHPHKETLDVLHGVKIFRTDTDGAIKIGESGKELEIKTYKDFQFKRVKSLTEEVKNIKRLFEKW